MAQFITVIHVFICCFLILIVLLQQGKGADAGATFGGGGQTFFGASGADNLLTKVTTFTAILFMCTSILLATSIQSDLSDQGEVMQMLETKPATPVTAPVSEVGPLSEDSVEGSAVSGEASTEDVSAIEETVGVEATTSTSENQDAGSAADEVTQPVTGSTATAVESSEAATAADTSTAGETESTVPSGSNVGNTEDAAPSTTSNASPMEGEAAQPQ